MRFPSVLHAVALGLSSMLGTAALSQETLSQDTKDAMLHVLAHEIGHAVLREFDLPILGPEEDIADDFATLYVYQTLPDRAEAIVAARARQNLADKERPGMFSEYRDDVQRAGRSVCLLYGQDPKRFEALAAQFGLAGDEAAACRNFPTEVGRSWRRLIAPYRMPSDARVTEVGMWFDASATTQALKRDDWAKDAYTLLSGIDWHSRVTLRVAQCDGGAGWSRNGRTMTICESYIQRFERQLTGQ